MLLTQNFLRNNHQRIQEIFTILEENLSKKGLTTKDVLSFWKPISQFLISNMADPARCLNFILPFYLSPNLMLGLNSKGEYAMLIIDDEGPLNLDLSEDQALNIVEVDAILRSLVETMYGIVRIAIVESPLMQGKQEEDYMCTMKRGIA